MIEPELAFADLNDDMACATAYLQYVVGFFFEFCYLFSICAFFISKKYEKKHFIYLLMVCFAGEIYP